MFSDECKLRMKAYTVDMWCLLALTLIAALIPRAQGGKCEGAFKSQHFCFGGNGKRSQIPQSPAAMPADHWVNRPLPRALFGHIGTNSPLALEGLSEPRDELPQQFLLQHRAQSTAARHRPILDERDLLDDYDNTVATDDSPADNELALLWQRLRTKLIQQKAREIYNEIEELLEEDDLVTGD